MGVRSRMFFGSVLTMALASMIAFRADAAGTLPEGWIVAGSAPQLYTMEIDRSTALEGRSSVVIASKLDASDSMFGTAMQTIDAEHYRGKRVRFSAHVKTENVAGWAGLWMRVDGPYGRMISLDNMGTRPIKGTKEWRTYEVVLDVPQESADIAFGMLVHGKGTAWLAKPQFAIVGSDAKTTDVPTQPTMQKEPTLTW